MMPTYVPVLQGYDIDGNYIVHIYLKDTTAKDDDYIVHIYFKDTTDIDDHICTRI